MDDIIREIMGLPYKNIYSYWQHYWNHCIDKLTDKDNVSFKIVGPRMLLVDLIDELEGHGLSNRDNIFFFSKHISELDKADEVFHSLCHPSVACLLQRLSNKDYKDSCIIICKKILDTLVKKQYFSLLVDWLADSIDKISDSNYITRKKVNDITLLVIAEYVAEGFSFDEIKRYATYIPDVAMSEFGNVISAPSEYDTLKKSDYSSEEEYYEAVSELIKNRDVYSRLDVLKKNYYAPIHTAYYIVRLNGLKGQIDDYIGDINIYSPKVKRYLNDESISHIEAVKEDRDRVNAAIPVEFKNYEQARVCATTKLEEVLDILMLTYRTNEPISMATNTYAIVEDGREIGSGTSSKGNDPMMSSSDESIRYLESLDLTDFKGGGFKYLTDKHHKLEVGKGALKIRLKNAAHWYSKAVASDKDVDVLLYSWFAIEGLIKVDDKTKKEISDKAQKMILFRVIQDFVISILCKPFFHYYLRDTYNDYLFLTQLNNNYYDITDSVISKAALNLKKGDHYRDSDFLNAIPDLMECINDDIAKDELAEVRSFYQNNNGYKIKANQLSEDILMIYRLRNMIVHNAALSCVNISFYAREAKFIAQQVIRYVIDKASGDITIDEIVIGAKVDYQVFVANYDEELRKIRGEK